MDRVVGQVRLTMETHVVSATPEAGGIRLELSDRTSRQVDHVILATGYKPSVQKLTFIEPTLRSRVRERDGYPVLNRWLESSVPGLHFVGGLADHSYGPICRFVSGADVASRQIATYASRARQ